MDPLTWFLISLALNVASYLLTPKPKAPTPEAAKQLEDPTAEAGKEIGVVFGDLIITDPNVLWFGEKSIRTYSVKV